MNGRINIRYYFRPYDLDILALYSVTRYCICLDKKMYVGEVFGEFQGSCLLHYILIWCFGYILLNQILCIQ
jgi:hypothetical protein